MNFCPGCGSANLDTDAACRVCGRSLREDATAQPVATATQSGTDQSLSTAEAGPAAPGGSTGWPAQAGAPVAQDRVVSSAMPSRPATGAATPSGFESAPPPTQARSEGTLPSFMRSEARSTTSQAAVETASLISENDLPDWIKQIAADDARKAAAARVTEEGPGVAGSSLPHHLGRRSLPGETLTGGPASSSWLNRRDAVAGAASSAWDATTPPAARPVHGVIPAQPPMAQTMPLAAETADGLSLIPGASETDAVPVTVEKPSRHRRRGAEKSASTEARIVDSPAAETSAKPSRGLATGFAGADQKRLLLMAAVAVAVVVLLVMMLR